jgi:peptidoglycan/xylan/chitin deacetylase (PgdA/CDA1 family)
MPSVPSAEHGRAPAEGGRGRFSGLAALVLVALALVIGLAASGRTESSRAAGGPTGARASATTTGETPAGQTKGEPKPAAKKLYRVVGCVSRGGPYRGGPARREVAIGFDDGPWPDTPEFVTMLERNHARATFFMIGEQVDSGYRATMLRELRDGDVLGDHTYTHPDLTLSREVSGQLAKTIGVIRAQTGYTPCIFRPPYGAYNESVVRTAHSLGLATVLWDVDPADWALPGTSTIVQRVLAQVEPGSIIISHDGGGPRGQTLAAYPQIIAALRRRGYRIVTILELLGFRNVYVPCIKLCDGIGIPRSQLPRNAIIRRAP